MGSRKRDKESMSKIFIPHELKTLSIDLEDLILRINGEGF